ncbi:MAG: hypothetical protein C4520_18125 [Candidatus Abyssobacteria bacterium SURF_5]|uniref:Spermidine synthase n=1 Tax=Abyssobacteria bacterium (strain SURF_5) TaxID=2093360 RepID=A0A3A4N3Y0_ABYX5|nr:MAG: hypothetical protein C4520_18125 [Candidatus Abyssubacteria bacterium SURF_5]
MKPAMNLGKRIYAGLFLITFSTLMYEVLLTRIYSVTMWYHFAFMAISIAIFGMSAGAILVYLLPRFFREERAKSNLSAFSFLYAISIFLSFLLQLDLPSMKNGDGIGFHSLAFTYITASIPFFFSGVCVCIALTKFTKQVSRLYAADLIGSAAGCIVLIQVLEIVDAPTAAVAVAFFGCMASFMFAAEAKMFKLKLVGAVCSLLLLLFVFWHTYLSYREIPVLKLKWAKGHREPAAYLYERWNSFSRITVSGNPHANRQPFGWGLSPACPPDQTTKELKLEIDNAAGTVLTGFDGDLGDLEYLRYDITNLAHYARPDSDVLVIGAGGGRDILSALVFKQKSVTGIEMNDAIVSAVNDRFGAFTGHLDQNPRVTFVSDEARSWVTRQKKSFDIIQLSLIDTWAATSAGAFVLSENSLYTVEAWNVFLKHLSPDGILTVSRWYHRFMPGEMYRLSSLAAASLRQLGVTRPRNHMVIVRRMLNGSAMNPDGIGTLLVSRRDFTNAQLETIEATAGAMGFEVVFSPRSAVDPFFTQIVSAKNIEPVAEAYPLDITPPTDDDPFFFNMLRIRDAFNPELWEQGNVRFNMEAVFVLAELLILVLILTLLFLVLPLLLKRNGTSLAGSLPLFIYFAGIGFGFMLIEISQMQRMIIFLGHPTYGLSIVLFSLLLSSGVGSYLTEKLQNQRPLYVQILFLLLLILITYGLATPHFIDAFEGSPTPIRILSAIAGLIPLGLFLGMAFPIGIKVAADKWKEVTPWFWAINGTTSVTASVLAIAISMNWTIGSAFWTGFVCYGCSFLSLGWLSRASILSWRRSRLKKGHEDAPPRWKSLEEW